MILALEPRTRSRLDLIESEEGVPALEVAHQAVDAWSHLRGEEERRAATWAVMQIVARRGHGEVG